MAKKWSECVCCRVRVGRQGAGWWSKGDFMIWAEDWEGAAVNGQLFLLISGFSYSLSVSHFFQLSEIHVKHKKLSSKCGFMRLLNSHFRELLMEAGILVLWVCGFLPPSLEKCGVEGRRGDRRTCLVCAVSWLECEVTFWEILWNWTKLS